jgi:hypothetical protein
MSAKATASAELNPIAPKQVARNPKSHAGEKIVVASKLPMALKLQLCSFRTERRKDRSTTWDEQVAYKHGPVVVINGTAFPNGDVPEGFERPEMFSGAALTFGVDREFFEKWLEENADMPAVANNMIFAAGDRDHVKGMAKEFKAVDSGLGALKRGKDDQGNETIVDHRLPKKVGNRGVLRGQTSEAAAAE